MSRTSDESFLSRWSRLKQQPGTAPDDGDAAVPPNERTAMRARDVKDELQAPDRQADEPAADVPDFSDFDFDQLDFNSDYTQFMDKQVPHDVRNKALRQLWLSDPVLANIDGLDDYCEDYTDAAVVPLSGIKTAYKIGRGFLSDSEVAEWEALGRPEPEATEVAAAGTATAADGHEEAGARAADELSPDAEQVAQSDHADTGSEYDDASPGAACGASVKLEEQAALDGYDDAAAQPAEASERAAHKPGTGT